MSQLEDGKYDVMIVNAQDRDDGVIALELAVSSGPHRGDVVELVATHLQQSWIDLLGTPGTLIVEGGEPRFVVDA